MKKIGKIFLLFILFFTTFDFGYYAEIVKQVRHHYRIASTQFLMVTEVK